MTMLALLLTLFAAPPDDFKRPNPPLGIAMPSLRSYIGHGNEGIELVSGCIQIGGDYVYTYKLTNTGKKKTWLVGSSIPDRALGLSSGDVAHYYKLKPGQTTTIKIKTTKDGPVEYMGTIRCYNKDRHNGIKEWFKERKATIEGEQPAYFFQMAGGANG